MWGYKKRGTAILSSIENELEARELITLPEIATADYYGSIEVLSRHDVPQQSSAQVGWPISSVLDEDRQLVSVLKETSLDQVETLMIMHNYSQIPVLSPAGRELHGTITWKALAGLPRPLSEATAQQAMIWSNYANYTAQSSDNLLTHISAIISNEYIYIRSGSNEFVGILTATDLAENFLQTAGPFIKIGEIEQRIRLLLDQLSLEKIREAALIDDGGRNVRSAADLTFGEYVRALQRPENWEQLGLAFDRTTVVKNLEEVNGVRNHVMHFRPRPLEAHVANAIDTCLNWLREARSR